MLPHVLHLLYSYILWLPNLAFSISDEQNILPIYEDKLFQLMFLEKALNMKLLRIIL